MTFSFACVIWLDHVLVLASKVSGKITSAWGARIAFVPIIPERVSTGMEVRIGLRRNAKIR
jgi:hypothetical protein